MIAIQTAPPATRRCATAFWERGLGRDRGLARCALAAAATDISASSGDVAASLAREKPGRLRTQGASISKRYARDLRLQTGGGLQPREARMTLPEDALGLLGCPQPGRARARVDCNLMSRRPDGLLRQDAQRRLAAADADRELRRARAAMLLPPEEALDDPVLERVEADDGDPPSGTERLERRREGGLERLQLVVDGDPQRLEDAPRRMTLAEAGRGRNRSLDRLHELTRALEGVLAPAAHDRPRDLACVPLLAVAAKDVGQLALARLVDEIARRVLVGRVHAHVERRVGRVRESALGPVDLHARNAEIEEDRVGAHAVVGEALENVGEIAAKEPRRDARPSPERLEIWPNARIPIDADELALALQVLGD